MSRTLDACIYLIKRRGLRGFTRAQIARQAGISDGAMGDMELLLSQAIRYAASKGEWRVVGLALQERHPAAMALKPHMLVKALEAVG